MLFFLSYLSWARQIKQTDDFLGAPIEQLEQMLHCKNPFCEIVRRSTKLQFVALLKQANTDSSKMAEVIGVSEAQLRFVTNTASGMGLIKCGSVVIPFDNQISKDTDLYNLYNTNIHEIIEMKKHANEKC